MAKRRDIDQVLSGELPYEQLDGPAQEVVRTAWDEDTARRIARLDFAAMFTAVGESWSDGAPDGSVIERVPSGR